MSDRKSKKSAILGRKNVIFKLFSFKLFDFEWLGIPILWFENLCVKNMKLILKIWKFVFFGPFEMSVAVIG